MKIVKLKGGLGNQMFQYAYALLLKKRTNENVALDYSAFQSLKNDTIRVPRIAKFNILLPKASDDQINSICKLKHNGNSQTFKYRLGIYIENKINKKYFIEPNRAYINPEKIIEKQYFDGYWQSWRYIEEVKEEIKREFVPNYKLSDMTLKYKNIIERENAVFVGVRKGDYTKEISHYGSFTSQYYENAMYYIANRIKNPVFYVFSNDITWSKENINWNNYNVKFREKEFQTDDFEELLLMASCKHAIIVNSSYNWWGAQLIKNKNKIVCCPQKWWFDDKPIDIILNEWIRIKDEI